MCTGNGGAAAGAEWNRGPTRVRRGAIPPFAALRIRPVAATGLLMPALLCFSAPAWGQGPEQAPLKTEISFTQFVQGPVAGGLEEAGSYGGKFELKLHLDLGKVGLVPGGSVYTKLATRYGDVATPNVGALVPVNTALIEPQRSGTATSLIALNYTQLIPLNVQRKRVLAVSVGRFAMLDLIPDGTGVTGMMNLGQLFPTTEARNVPLVTLGLSASYIVKGEALATLMLMQSKSSSMTSGFENFDDGVTIYPSVTIPTRFFGRTGHHGLNATWSSRDVTPIADIPTLFLPRLDTLFFPHEDTLFFPGEDTVTVDKKRGSWSFTYMGDQYIREDAESPHRGWRVYWAASVADQSTNPIQWYLNLGAGGNSPIRGRQRLDRFGIGAAYSGIGDDFKDVFDRVDDVCDRFEDVCGRFDGINDEGSLELFYNWGIRKWARLTGDVQVVWPFREDADVALVPGVRFQLVF